ncbi:hypothetical protein F5878DRAFT_621833 [Lentinula raphanica]|uniref:F-box domain-containing protein n=1 Tax=Lentinula raphanica TaxID=153919 RepID=A0AA38UDM5_9AGAR|nr:hypothetical protein F5878DRAFT_621833 [Lentinula raphanica]
MTTVVKSLAKLSLTKPKVDLPGLPEELWFTILRHACQVSDLCDAPQLLRLPLGLHRKARVKQMKFQLRIILVCKAWYRIAFPCLFEEIAILHNVGLCSIFDLILKNSLGHVTKRLDVYANTPLDARVFSTLLSCLVHLRIVNIANSSGQYIPAPISECIYAHPNLTAVNTTRLENHSNVQCVVKEPTLQVVSLSACFFTKTVEHYRYNLSKVTQLYVLEEPYITPRDISTHMCGNMPSVTSILFGQLISDEFPYLLDALYKFLPNLHFVGIQTTFHCLSLPFSEGSLDEYHFSPSVHTFGLIFKRPKATTRNYRRFCGTLRRFHGESLKVIRLGEETVNDLHSRPFAAKLVEDTFRSKGWRMEVGDMYV